MNKIKGIGLNKIVLSAALLMAGVAGISMQKTLTWTIGALDAEASEKPEMANWENNRLTTPEYKLYFIYAR